jgi:hypothetical protein
LVVNNLSKSDVSGIVEDSTKVNMPQLIVGIVVFIIGLTMQYYSRHRLYILNINGYYEIQIENHMKDLGLSRFEFKEKEINFIKMYNNGINEQRASDIVDEISHRVANFKNESLDVKRGYTGIAPVPFIMLAGTIFTRDSIQEFYEFDKKKDHYYKLTSINRNIKNLFRKKIYPSLKLKTNIGNIDENAKEVVIAVSVTASIQPSALTQFSAPFVNLSIDSPHDNVIIYKEQLQDYRCKVYDTILEIQKKMPDLKRIHLLYCGQSCLAFEIGEMVDDRRMIEIVSYHFNMQSSVKYPWGLVVNGESKGHLIMGQAGEGI